MIRNAREVGRAGFAKKSEAASRISDRRSINGCYFKQSTEPQQTLKPIIQKAVFPRAPKKKSWAGPPNRMRFQRWVVYFLHVKEL